MEWTGTLFASCVLLLNQCLAISINFTEFELHIERTSRLYRHRHARPNDTIISESTDEEGNAWENSGKFEGDIILNNRQRLQIIQQVTSGGALRNALKPLSKKWPNNVVIYKIKDNSFAPNQIQAIKKATKYIQKISCLKFRIYKKGDKGGVLISGNQPGCYSDVGYHQGKWQTMNLYAAEDGCFRHGIIVHEFLHVVGFVHMHSNPTRDKFVEVHWDNIEPLERRNFMMYNSDDITDFGVLYDLESIMHYSRRAFSISGAYTISPLKPTKADIGQRDYMTPSDIKKLNLMYCGTDSPNKKKLKRLNELREQPVKH